MDEHNCVEIALDELVKAARKSERERVLSRISLHLDVMVVEGFLTSGQAGQLQRRLRDFLDD